MYDTGFHSRPLQYELGVNERTHDFGISLGKEQAVDTMERRPYVPG